MTDLQRHLSLIGKLLRHALTDTALAALPDALRSALPASYGVAAGPPLIVYDAPLAARLPSPPDGGIRPEAVLLVIAALPTLTSATFTPALDLIAAAKTAAPRPAVPDRARRGVPRDRLPFGWVMAQQSTLTWEALAAALHQHPASNWPDQIDLLADELRFRHPLLDEAGAVAHGFGWTRLPELRHPNTCYVCKRTFHTPHVFYAHLCPRCADLNYARRTAAADLTGRRVLLTGGRVGIGYAAALRLLRAGAEVIVTSRFPRDAARRYALEPDSDRWRDRLRIYGLDLRLLPSVEAFAAHLLDTYPALDALINNAAQTVKAPPDTYAPLLDYERSAINRLPDGARPLLAAPETDAHLQQFNSVLPSGGAGDSWLLRLEDVSALELVEVQVINAVAPALLAGRLKPLLLRSSHPTRVIVNVTAAEGQFAQTNKSGRHPHTNMAKAALNMLTRTIAADYAADGIAVLSVDPGWVTEQAPLRTAERQQRSAAQMPLDLTDAAARVCDPLWQCAAGQFPPVGVLVKDYQVVSW